ncbi:related to Tyrosine specific protein phosphatase and dual specificity protein phosphatase [Sporisorium reilianum SRZ2]|uniref:protein-tyrosine-phosphatase n=1 Tax=Sporisorium reilianum (strain SRZ2) TaxID=999809 RepID=E6ZRK9_SPORE|nr:related to Tyrosine specific protein phosphatase and dual specificity protein phosphatase [Sporisorium reilianum SRZ2]
MDEVLPGLWVGGVRAAMDADYLSRAGITHIVTCMKQQIPVPPPLADGRRITRNEMKHVRIDDDEKAPILVHFAGCNELISSQLAEEWVADVDAADSAVAVATDDTVEQLVRGRQKRNGRWGTWQTTGAGTVLVHCQAGCSRSVAIVAAYLMHTRHIAASTAISMLQRRREHAEPNRGFVAQLELYQQVGFEVDMKWQAVRRFLMSKTDILNGDSMDDMLLSYYPSPYPSPALSAATGIKGFTALRPNGDHAGAASTLDETTMAAETQTQTNFRCSDPEAQNENSQSNSPPPPSALSRNDSSVPRLVHSLSTMTAPSSSSDAPAETATAEVKVTANSSGRLPGGVEHVRGHEGVLNRGLLAQPSFQGPKLRCKGCRRELVALDHVVIHEPGRGQMAFDHRRRDVGHSGQNVATNSANDEVVTDEGSTAKAEAAAEATDAAQPQTPAGTSTTGSASSSTLPSAASAAVATKPRIQSAASLASQLPPHLAALRAGRSVMPRPPSSSSSTASMLKHASCSSYFIEPMAWMTDLSSGEVTGRLNCPSAKCGQKLGSWDWAGMQCGCGAWVTPAFSLHRSKVDEV